eukprot:SM000153S01589  [mRNA]  locus=s153:65187:74651:- [translate_table: standard]
MVFRKGSLVEVAGSGDGFQGSWWTAVVLQRTSHQLLIDDEPLRWRPRCAIEAFYNDGWWQGLVTHALRAADGTGAVVEYGVYFPTTSESLHFAPSMLRTRQDCIHGIWHVKTPDLVVRLHMPIEAAGTKECPTTSESSGSAMLHDLKGGGKRQWMDGASTPISTRPPPLLDAGSGSGDGIINGWDCGSPGGLMAGVQSPDGPFLSSAQRKMEQRAYHAVLSAFHLQSSSLDIRRQRAIVDLRMLLHIDPAEHAAFLAEITADSSLNDEPKRARSPAVLALLLPRDRIFYSDATLWAAVCSQVDSVKQLLLGRNTRMIVLMTQATLAGEVNEDRLSALRKRAEVEARACLQFVTDDPGELKRSLTRFAAAAAENASQFYRDEAKRLKGRMDRKARLHPDLAVRYDFKAAVLAEFLRDWVSALKHYEFAYSMLLENLKARPAPPPVQRMVEVRAVAGQLHFKICTLLLHSSREAEAVRRQRAHVAYFQARIGPPDGSFLHWAWLSNQYKVFAELVQQRLASGLPPLPVARGPAGTAVTDRELQPAYYYQMAGQYAIQKQRSFEAELATSEAFGLIDTEDVLSGSSEALAPPLYVGQSSRLVNRGPKLEMQRATEAEFVRHALLVERLVSPPHAAALALLTRAHEEYRKAGHASRAIFALGTVMARLYWQARDFASCRRLLDSVASVYRREAWVALLAANLHNLRACCRHLGLIKDYVEYTLELAALPLPDSQFQGLASALFSPEASQDDLSTSSVQRGIFDLLQGGVVPACGDGQAELRLDSSGPPLEVVTQGRGPLRGALVAAAYFMDQSAQLGKAARLTLALLTHLPLPLRLSHLSLAFSSRDCESTLVGLEPQGRVAENTDGISEAPGQEQKGMFDSEATGGTEVVVCPREWLLLHYDVTAHQGGLLDCLGVVACIGPHASISWQVDAFGAVLGEEVALPWATEAAAPHLPALRLELASEGHRAVQVEEPRPLVDVILDCAGPGLVGECLPARVGVASRGHSVLGGELRLALAPLAEAAATEPARTSGETLPIRILVRDDSGNGAAVLRDSPSILAVPDIAAGGQWFSDVYLRWQEPIGVRLTASITYTAADSEEGGGHGRRFEAQKSMHAQCEDALLASCRLVAPCRQASLLPGAAAASVAGGSSEALAIEEPCTLVATVRSGASTPITLLSVCFEEADPASCSVVPAGSGSDHDASNELGWDLLKGGGSMAGVELAQEATFVRLFNVTALVASPHLLLGSLILRWRRAQPTAALGCSGNGGGGQPSEVVTMRVKVPPVLTEAACLTATLVTPDLALLGRPFHASMTIANNTPLLQEVAFSVADSGSFLFAGARTGTISILPHSSHNLPLCLVPLTSGMLALPQLQLHATRYRAAFRASQDSSKLFAHPSVPASKPESVMQAMTLMSVGGCRFRLELELQLELELELDENQLERVQVEVGAKAGSVTELAERCRWAEVLAQQMAEAMAMVGEGAEA